MGRPPCGALGIQVEKAGDVRAARSQQALAHSTARRWSTSSSTPTSRRCPARSATSRPRSSRGVPARPAAPGHHRDHPVPRQALPAGAPVTAVAVPSPVRWRDRLAHLELRRLEAELREPGGRRGAVRRRRQGRCTRPTPPTTGRCRIGVVVPRDASTPRCRRSRSAASSAPPVLSARRRHQPGRAVRATRRSSSTGRSTATGCVHVDVEQRTAVVQPGHRPRQAQPGAGAAPA